ncbi:NAD-dependent epimerase/dehydratase family protein [Lysobacter sp. TY2-98]|uniref:NAD-dependent epimerase/dehydratase family protein n=1 Tax=Lysobacter sp. TY2-98 TaxID=2290922 RepID=UPI000E2067F7|nr:NAD-dependent epimerase/dehydratase family protein [Lysobacter sp. TY2-98]AXK71460.1 NAD-dependent epimerase/dehydratase family protein [Lysobacter sp. TY2-98]
MTASQRIVVTGATGFLGGAVARRLHATRPDVQVRAVGRDAARGAALTGEGIEFVRTDLCDAAAVRHAVDGADAVIHAAALSSPWGARPAFVAANIDATENIARACAHAGVSRLVHISTPGIYHDGRPHLGIREDDALPARAVNDYADTKRIAERRVLELTDGTSVSTLILRPRAIFGPGDSSLLPRIAEALRRRRLPRIGDGRCTVDLTYIDNAVDAVLNALEAPVMLHGRAYNISNGEPARIWDVIDRLAAALGEPAPRRHVSASLLGAVASALERVHRIAMPQREPALLRYGVELLSVDMTLDISRARSELGYQPRVALDDALSRTFAALVEQGT